MIIDELTSDITIYTLAYKIQDGTLSSDLLRPVHPVLTNTLVNSIANKALSFIVLIPVWIVLVLLFHPDFSAVTWQSFLLTIPTVILAYATSFLLGATVTSLAFWTTRVYSINEFYFALITLFSGQFVPLQLMPPFIQGLAQFLPFQMFKYVPIQVLLNKLPASVLLRDAAVGAAWFFIALFLFNWVWRKGVKRFSAVGA